MRQGVKKLSIGKKRKKRKKTVLVDKTNLQLLVHGNIFCKFISVRILVQ